MAAGSSKTSVSSLWPHYLALGLLGFTALLGLARYWLFDWSDPQRCNALLNEGTWMDSYFREWQPEGCMMYKYQAKDVSICLAKRRVVFAGDSITRQLFFNLAHIADPKLPSEPPNHDQKHVDHRLTTSGKDVDFEFIWDPFLNGTQTQRLLEGRREGPNEPPALVVLGSGLWYLRHAETSGGMAAWEGMIDRTFSAVAQGNKAIADKVVLLPVEETIGTKLTPDRAASIHAADVDAMNSDLAHRVYGTPSWGSSLFDLSPQRRSGSALSLPLVFNKMLNPSQTDDGLHFSPVILATQANLLLNMRCNDVLPKKLPFDKTCCRSYPTPYVLQALVIFLVLVAGLAARLVGPRVSHSTIASLIPSVEYAVPLSVFGSAVFLQYFADRMGVWLKEQKHYDPWAFGALCIMALGVGLGTMKKADKDLGFLNRDQTDEWKGWMQIAILIYHYLGASKISGIYNPIRVLVAAYLWMSGYGHFTFYFKKADFGFLRIAQVMVRLNLLTIALAYVMDADYLYYYFAPLVSLWFLVIYATMALGSQYNERTVFMVGKMLVSALVVTWIFKSGWIIEGIFTVLERFCNIRWSAKEWIFRVTLDMWIVYFGMFTAFAFIKIKEHRLTDSPYWAKAERGAIAASVLGLLWFFWFELSQPTKFTYNAYHPYMSFIPVTAFVVLRNATPTLRSTNSKVFAFIGKCSLETFILQYHCWLAGDTKGILMVLPFGTRWRPLNMVVSTIVFIFVSHKVAEATGSLTNWICGAPKKKNLPLPVTSSTTNGAVADSIPLMVATPKEGQTAKGSGDVEKEVIFDAAAPSSSSSTRPTPSMDVPEGPDRPVPRWLGRLADGPMNNPSWSPSATRNRIFTAWSEGSIPQGLGLGMKAASILVGLWILNILWPN